MKNMCKEADLVNPTEKPSLNTCVPLRWLPIVVKMETGTKIEILSLAGSHAC